MERNRATTVENLDIGDRFYKAKDKKRIVYTRVVVEGIKWACLKDGDRYPAAFKPGIEVIFLRHGETKQE